MILISSAYWPKFLTECKWVGNVARVTEGRLFLLRFFFLLSMSSLSLCRCAKARMHVCHCYLSSTLALVRNTNHSNCALLAPIYPTTKTSTTPAVYTSTIPWHPSSPLSPQPYAVRSTCACWVPAASPVWMSTSTSMTSAMHASSSPSPSTYRCRSTDPCPCIVTTGAFTCTCTLLPDPVNWT